MYLAIGKVATMIGVSISTLRRWDEANTFSASYHTVGGHRRYKLVKILLFCKNIGKFLPNSDQIPSTTLRVVTYARVSSSRQREDLKRQQDYLTYFTQKRQWTLLKAYRDIGSGLNDKRISLLQMLKDLPVFQPDIIVCSYEDRLARFGTTLIQTICEIFGTKLIFVKKQDQQASLNDQLVTDVIAVITSFAGKIHRRRRGRQNLPLQSDQ